MSVLGENNSRRLSNFLQTHFFGTLIIFLESTIKLITEIFDFQE